MSSSRTSSSSNPVAVARARTPAPLSGSGFYQYVSKRAVAYGLDPQAVLAVASREGLGGGVGDNGTSFGPWQLHAGGALPASVWAHGPTYAQSWAWSPAGIDYALSRMVQAGAGNLSGPSAIEVIVSRFERPAQPGPEIAGADAAYGAPSGSYSRVRPDTAGGGSGGGGGGGGITGAIGDAAGDTFSELGKAWRGVLSPISGPADFLRMALWLVDPKTWLRAVEFVAGAGLLILSLRGLFQLFVERETGVSFNTVAGAAGALEKRSRPRRDQLIPGNSQRRRGRQERRQVRDRETAQNRYDPDNPLLADV